MSIPIYFDDDYSKLPPSKLDEKIWLTNDQYINLLNMLHAPSFELIPEIVSKLNAELKNAPYNTLLKKITEYGTEIRTLRTGEHGENTVYDRLANNGEGWTVLRNLNIPFRDSSTEIDFVCFANGHVFAIEVKNYHFKTMRFTKDGSVTGIENTNSEINLLTQVEDHEMAVRQCLNQHMDVPSDVMNAAIQSMVVIANDQADNKIENETNIPIVKLVMARRTIVSMIKDRAFSEEQEQQAIQALKTSSLPNKRFPFINPFLYEPRLEQYLDSLDKEEIW